MSTRRGSFGFMLPSWEIDDDRVTIYRRWRSALFAAALIPLGIWLALQAFDRDNRDTGKLYVVGAVGALVVGVFGLAAPMWGVRRIEATRDGLRVDGTTYVPDEVRTLYLEHTSTSYRGNRHHQWQLVIDHKYLMPPKVTLAREQNEQANAQMVVEAMNATLRGQKPPVVLVATRTADGNFVVSGDQAT